MAVQQAPQLLRIATFDIEGFKNGSGMRLSQFSMQSRKDLPEEIEENDN